MKNYYKILQVSRSASKEQIRSSFKKLAKQYHPDRPNGSAERFKEINEAYTTLRDPQKRQQYDLMGQGFGNQGYSQGYQSPGYGHPGFGSPGYGQSGFGNQQQQQRQQYTQQGPTGGYGQQQDPYRNPTGANFFKDFEGMFREYEKKQEKQRKDYRRYQQYKMRNPGQQQQQHGAQQGETHFTFTDPRTGQTAHIYYSSNGTGGRNNQQPPEFTEFFKAFGNRQRGYEQRQQDKWGDYDKQQKEFEKSFKQFQEAMGRVPGGRGGGNQEPPFGSSFSQQNREGGSRGGSSLLDMLSFQDKVVLVSSIFLLVYGVSILMRKSNQEGHEATNPYETNRRIPDRRVHQRQRQQQPSRYEDESEVQEQPKRRNRRFFNQENLQQRHQNRKVEEQQEPQPRRRNKRHFSSASQAQKQADDDYYGQDAL